LHVLEAIAHKLCANCALEIQISSLPTFVTPKLHIFVLACAIVYLEINPKVSILLVLFLVYKYVICNII
jgi:hypothetical protein